MILQNLCNVMIFVRYL